ncbi:MAG: DNA primase [Moraxella sp.]|nr:DNA primase [Moraxella sp.]
MKIPASTLEQLNAQADLVAIIRRHTTLKPAGREFKGCCPFHGEKTPSFYVNPQTNLYYCFGCGAKGNAISFLMDYERLTFIEAAKELAQKTGIDLPKDNENHLAYQRQAPARPKAPQAKPDNTPAPKSTHKPHNNPNLTPTVQNPPPTPARPNDSEGYEAFFDSDFHAPDPADTAAWHSPEPQTSLPADFHFSPNLSGQEGNLYQLLAAVTDFYQSMLKKHPAAMDYLKKRGLSDESIAYFQLGFAPSGWQNLSAVFSGDVAGLRQLGLIKKSKNGREFDFFRERIIFPIKDRQGRVVGFAGRAMSDDITPKYLNSSESALFQKQHILYGYHEARTARADNWLIVEGYLDVIALHQAGIYGAVAPMGTALSEPQLTTLLRFNDTLTLSFDGDAAGQKAALRSLEVAIPILNDGKSLKFLTLPDNHDPDSYVQAFGKDAMRSAINNALPLSDYLYAVLSSKYQLDRPEEKAAAMAHLRQITDRLPKGSSFRWWLNSDIYNRLKAKPQKNRPSTADSTGSSNDNISPSEQLLLCILYQPTLILSNPLQNLYVDAGLTAIDDSFKEKLTVPTLPTWEHLHIDTHTGGLSELITAVQTLLPFLNPASDELSVDSNAHLILSALENPALQSSLGGLWRDFFYHTKRHKPEHIKLLFDELLCHVVMSTFRHALQNAQGLLLTTLYKKRLLALEAWDKTVIKPAIENSLNP